LVPPRSLDDWEKLDKEVIETGKVPEDAPIEEALTKVDSLVDDALNRIEQYLLPYFDEIAVELGLAEGVSELAKRRKS
jgi:predicted transcriptional regulator